MIRVAFIGNYTKEWMGGVNYLGNLLYALSKLEDKKIKSIVFLGKKADAEILQKFEPYAEIVQDTLFDKKSLKWILSRLLEKFFNTTMMTTRILKKHNIAAVSHINQMNSYKDIIKISWIPDFQHIYLPEFFSKRELEHRNQLFLKTLSESQSIIVSSQDAYQDCSAFAPEFIDKVHILHFVSQPNPKVFALDVKYRDKLEDKYQFKGKFFYLPNQFWKHKNHMLVFQAVKLLKDQGIEVLILCSGLMSDYRYPEYAKEIDMFVRGNYLENNIKLLGLIDYDDVYYFIRNSLAVINSSLFEGWSSTVEECKSIGKNMILSGIPIHKEQNPPDSLYFDPHDASELSEQLKQIWNRKVSIPNIDMEKRSKEQLDKRTIDFAYTYEDIVLKSVQGSINEMVT